MSGPVPRAQAPKSDPQRTRGATTSQRATVPAPEAVPCRILELDELGWLALDEDALRLAEVIDGVRTIRELAALRGISLGLAQMLIGHLRERHVISFA